MRAERVSAVLVSAIVLSCVHVREVRADLISHWTFDGHLEDDVANNDGTFHGINEAVFVEDREGNPESAISLNGFDELVQVDQATSLPLYQHATFSVSMWVKGGVQNDKRVWAESTTRNRAGLYNLGTQNRGVDGRFDLYVRGDNGAAAAPHTYSTAQPFDDTWHHIVFVDNNGRGVLWVDGLADPAPFSYVRPSMDLDLTTIGGILRRNDDGSNHYCCMFLGAIDDVRVFDHALSEAEIHEISPPEGCPEEGDTHCDDLLVEGPIDGDPGLYTITALDAVDDSGDAIFYTFTRDNGQGLAQVVGPQLDNFVQLNLGDGTWTISVTVDDDPLCADAADDSTCSTDVEVLCPDDGDTHCDSLGLDGPADNVPGTYTLTAIATDDSGDIINYTFAAQRGDDPARTVATNQTGIANVVLTGGDWTLSVRVDDRADCDDVADDSSCSLQIDIEAPDSEMVAHYTLDGHLDDETGNTEATSLGFEDPVFVDGFDGAVEGAMMFDGFESLLSLNWSGELDGGLALFGNEGYTVSMWVSGGPQPDFRVFSEASTFDGNPLVNIGTQSQGVTGQVDLYIRSGPAQINHRWSAREAFVPDEWHHICWVDSNGEAVLYIDGVRDATNYTYNKPTMPTDTTTIGGILRASPSHWFSGAIDEVKLFNHALTAAEVSALVPEPEDCPDEGDTHCDDFLVEPAADDGIGQWTFTAFDAFDDSGDPILYTFTAANADGAHLQSGPGPDPVAVLSLGGGAWTVTLSVDDDLLCRDVAADASCSRDIEVIVPEPLLVSHWTFDEDLLDSQESGNDGRMIGGDPVFVEGHDGNPEGAVRFDGVDDMVQMAHNDGLPLFHGVGYSIAMWVRGDGTVGAPNADDRVWSESTASNNTPLFNIGTHVNGTGPQVDIYIRAIGSTPVSHRLSTGAAFDGTWHHIVWVDEGGDAALYIDGVRDATDFRYAKPSPENMPLDITTVGGILRGGPCCLFTGDIDAVCVFNYKLSDDEVMSIYEDGCGDDGPPPPEENCEQAGDEDGNGLADCDDPACEDLPECQDDGVGPFQRGDVDSNGNVELTDGVFVFNFLFLGGPGPECRAAADTSLQGDVNLTSGVYVLNFLFLGGPPPPAPYPGCGSSTQESDTLLGCETPQACN